MLRAHQSVISHKLSQHHFLQWACMSVSGWWLPTPLTSQGKITSHFPYSLLIPAPLAFIHRSAFWSPLCTNMRVNPARLLDLPSIWLLRNSPSENPPPWCQAHGWFASVLAVSDMPVWFSAELPYGWEKIEDPQYGTYYVEWVCSYHLWSSENDGWHIFVHSILVCYTFKFSVAHLSSPFTFFLLSFFLNPVFQSKTTIQA